MPLAVAQTEERTWSDPLVVGLAPMGRFVWDTFI